MCHFCVSRLLFCLSTKLSLLNLGTKLDWVYYTLCHFVLRLQKSIYFVHTQWNYYINRINCHILFCFFPFFIIQCLPINFPLNTGYPKNLQMLSHLHLKYHLISTLHSNNSIVLTNYFLIVHCINQKRYEVFTAL